MKVLDTSVAADHLRGFPPAVELLHRLVSSEEQIVASEIVRFEWVAGDRDRARDALDAFFEIPSWCLSTPKSRVGPVSSHERSERLTAASTQPTA